MQMPDAIRVSSNVTKKWVSSSENPENSNGQLSLKKFNQSEHFSAIFKGLEDSKKVEEPNSSAIDTTADQPIDQTSQPEIPNEEETPKSAGSGRSESTGDNLLDEAGRVLRKTGDEPKIAVDFQGNVIGSNLPMNLSHPRYFQSQFDPSALPRPQNDQPRQANGIKIKLDSLRDPASLQGERFQSSLDGPSQKFQIPNGLTALPLKPEASQETHVYKQLGRDVRGERTRTSHPTETQNSPAPSIAPGEKSHPISGSSPVLPQHGAKQPFKATDQPALQLGVSDPPVGARHSRPDALQASAVNQIHDAVSPRLSTSANKRVGGTADTRPPHTGQQPKVLNELTDVKSPLLPNRSNHPETGDFVARAKAISPAPDINKNLERKEFSASVQDGAQGTAASTQSRPKQAKPIALLAMPSARADQLFDDSISNGPQAGLRDESPDQELGHFQISEQSRGTSVSPQFAANRAGVPHHIPKQLAEVIQTSGSKSVDVALSPEELGRVRLSITQAESGLLVNIQAERPETLEMLRRNIEQLDKELQLLGYADPGFSFSSEGGEPDKAPEKTITKSPTIEEHASAFPSPSTADRNLDPKIQSGVDIRL